VVTAEGVEVLHVVDLAEIPTVQLAQRGGGATPTATARCPTPS
jgi:hypothetical protein